MSAPRRVLFVCIGNSCRSQMAEAFARSYGSGVIEAASAGLAPAAMIAPDTRQVMLEKNVGMDGQRPKSLYETGVAFDLIVNLSGHPLPRGLSAPAREWKVEDPIWQDLDRHRQIRDQIEGLVQELVIEFRRAPKI